MDKTIHSLGEFIAYVQECKNKDYPSMATDKKLDKIIYRGHANKSWKCLPKLFRQQEWYENEKIIINEIIRRCPNEFEGLSAFEKLVKMQHYGAPTRLLDFTGNPLIALYFACDDNTQKEEDGEVLLGNLPMLYEEQIPIEVFLKDLFPDRQNQFIEVNAKVVDPVLASSNAMGIRAKLRNERIKNQDGYFVFFTYSNRYITELFNPLEANPFIKENIIIPSECKKNILRELNDYGINRAYVYPELENQIKEICRKYD